MKKKIFIPLLIVVFILLASVPSLYFYNKYKSLSSSLSKVSQKEDPNAIIANVGKLILLPSGETPTIMTVTDKQKLTGQQFFTNAKNGDKVLIYEKAKKAFLYDPVADKIIEVSPIATASPTAAPQTKADQPPAGTATPQSRYTFALYNATPISGFTKTYEPKLVSKVPGAQVVVRGNAKGDYTKSILVDVSGTYKAQSSALAGTLGLSLIPMPAGETTPSADFLIILAADQK